MRRPRVMRARIRATSFVPKRTAIQKTVMLEERRVRSCASSVPWRMSLRRTLYRRVARAGASVA